MGLTWSVVEKVSRPKNVIRVKKWSSIAHRRRGRYYMRSLGRPRRGEHAAWGGRPVRPYTVKTTATHLWTRFRVDFDAVAALPLT